MLIPGSLAMIVQLSRERGGAIGLWTGLLALTTAADPLLARRLARGYATVARSFLYQRADRPTDDRNSDFACAGEPRRLESDCRLVGAFLAAVGLAGIVFGLTAASHVGSGYPIVLAALLGSGLVGLSPRFQTFDLSSTSFEPYSASGMGCAARS